VTTSWCVGWRVRGGVGVDCLCNLAPCPTLPPAFVQTAITTERDGGTIDRAQIKSVLELFIVMGVCLNRNNFKNKREVEELTRSKDLVPAATDVYCVVRCWLRAAARAHSPSQPPPPSLSRHGTRAGF